METATTAEPQHSQWFQEFIASMERIEKRQEETSIQMKENSLKAQESSVKFDRELAESRARFEREMKESKDDFNLKIGRLTNLFGDFTIGMVAPMLREKFGNIGLVFQRSSTNVLVDDYVNDIHFEIDVLLENSDKAVLVEVKTKLTKERIKKHIERLEKMRKYSDLHGDKRTYLGAVAGFTIAHEEKNTALNEGLYVIEPSGEDFVITAPDSKPREW